MCVGVRVESHRRLARFLPLPGGLGRFGSMEGIPAADMARVRVFVAYDGVSCCIQGLVAVADQPFPRSVACGTVPITVDHAQGMPLFQERPESRQGLTCRGPLVLPGSQVILRLRLPAASVARVVLPIVLDAVLLDALDLLELSIDERGLVLVALPLLAADSLEIFAFFAKCEQFVF